MQRWLQHQLPGGTVAEGDAEVGDAGAWSQPGDDAPLQRGHQGRVPSLFKHLHEQGQEARSRPAGAASPPVPGEARRGPAAAPRHRRGQRQDVLSLPCTSQRALYITSAA